MLQTHGTGILVEAIQSSLNSSPSKAAQSSIISHRFIYLITSCLTGSTIIIAVTSVHNRNTATVPTSPVWARCCAHYTQTLNSPEAIKGILFRYHNPTPYSTESNPSLPRTSPDPIIPQLSNAPSPPSSSSPFPLSRRSSCGVDNPGNWTSEQNFGQRFPDDDVYAWVANSHRK